MTIDIPDLPPAPWLRLAHVARFAGAAETPAGLRRLRDWELLLVTAGRTWLAVEGGEGRLPLLPGSAVLMPPGPVFDWGVDEHVHIAVHFELHPSARPTTGAGIAYLPGALPASPCRRLPTWTLRDRRHPVELPFVRSGPAVAEWPARCAPLLRLWSHGGARTPTDRLRAAAIIAGLLADWLAMGSSVGEDRVRDLLDRLAAEPCDRAVAIPVLARRCGLGEAAFRSAVLAATGLTPRRWLEARRVAAVAEVLADPRVPVARVAALAGYADPFHFARVVRRVTGKAPIRHRLG